MKLVILIDYNMFSLFLGSQVILPDVDFNSNIFINTDPEAIPESEIPGLFYFCIGNPKSINIIQGATSINNINYDNIEDKSTVTATTYIGNQYNSTFINSGKDCENKGLFINAINEEGFANGDTFIGACGTKTTLNGHIKINKYTSDRTEIGGCNSCTDIKGTTNINTHGEGVTNIGNTCEYPCIHINGDTHINNDSCGGSLHIGNCESCTSIRGETNINAYGSGVTNIGNMCEYPCIHINGDAHINNDGTGGSLHIGNCESCTIIRGDTGINVYGNGVTNIGNTCEYPCIHINGDTHINNDACGGSLTIGNCDSCTRVYGDVKINGACDANGGSIRIGNPSSCTVVRGEVKINKQGCETTYIGGCDNTVNISGNDLYITELAENCNPSHYIVMDCEGKIYKKWAGCCLESPVPFDPNAAPSSIRFKTNIENLYVDDCDLFNIQEVTFNYIPTIKNGRMAAGFIAEDLVGTPFEFAIIYDADGYPSAIDYTSILIYLFSAYKNKYIINEARFEALENNCFDLQTQCDYLQNQYNNVKAQCDYLQFIVDEINQIERR